MSGWWETGPQSLLLLPCVHYPSSAAASNMSSQTCSHALSPWSPHTCPIPQAALPCHLSSPWPHARWPPATRSTQALMTLQHGSTGTHTGVTWRNSGHPRRKQWTSQATGRDSPMAEQGLLRCPRHRHAGLSVLAHPYKAPAGSADTRETPGGTGGLRWPELPSPSASNLQHHATPHPLSRNPTSPGRATSSRDQMSANPAARGALRAA